MNHNAPLIVDVDDTILDWIGSFRIFMSERLGREIKGLPDVWDMSSWLGVPPEDILKAIQEHNTSIVFARLDPIEGAREALAAAFDFGAPIHVVTSCSTDEMTVRRRTDNLHGAFGDIFSSITCLDLGQSKRPKLLQIKDEEGPGLWVEDNHAKAIEGLEVGHQAFVLRRGHNRALEVSCDRGLQWVDHWDEISYPGRKKDLEAIALSI